MGLLLFGAAQNKKAANRGAPDGTGRETIGSFAMRGRPTLDADGVSNFCSGNDIAQTVPPGSDLKLRYFTKAWIGLRNHILTDIPILPHNAAPFCLLRRHFLLLLFSASRQCRTRMPGPMHSIALGRPLLYRHS